MTGTDIMHMLLGAGLVSVGVVMAALAERIRANRTSRNGVPRERPIRTSTPFTSFTPPTAATPAKATRLSRGVEDPASPIAIPVLSIAAPVGQLHQAAHPAAPTKEPRMPRAELKIQSSPSGAEANDVIAALVSTGYKKQIAAEATWACDASERTTIEDWTRAALRRARA